MPSARAQPSSSLRALSTDADDSNASSHSGVVERSAAGHGVPTTTPVLEAMNVFANTGAFATLLVVAAVTLAWRGAVHESVGWGVLSGAVLASALGLFAQGRAKLLDVFEAACIDEGVPLDEAQRRARAALHDALPRRCPR